MQIGPSNNLLEALSQLQGGSQPARPAAPRAAAKASDVKAVDFAAEVRRSAPVASLPATTAQPSIPAPVTQPVASVEHPEYPVLGRHINILV